MFGQAGRIDLLDLVTTEHNEYVPRADLLQTAAASPDIKQSPSQSKAVGKRGSQQRQKQQVQAAQDQSHQVPIPDSMVNDCGTTKAVWQFLEVSIYHPNPLVNPHTKSLEQIAETLSSMQTLFHFAQQKPNLSLNESLNELSLSFQNASQLQHQTAFNPSLHQQQQQQQQHALNPALQLAQGGSSHFVSPAQAAHLNLPVNTTSASPATLNMSPAMQTNALQNHIGGNSQQLQQPPTSVSMVSQQSQQGTTTSGGTGSQATSANASPNVTNKRRRSAVKAEGDDGGGGGVEVNGTGAGPKTVKPSPRVSGGGKRQKGNG